MTIRVPPKPKVRELGDALKQRVKLPSAHTTGQRYNTRSQASTAGSFHTIGRDLSYALDRSSLMRAAGFIPDPWQERLLRSAGKRHILLCSRQSGKSTVTAVLALAEALYRDESLILLVSQSLRQSQELYRKVRMILAALPNRPNARHETATFIEFENGSRIVSLPGEESTIRGYSNVTVLVVDEAAQVGDELYYSVRPMLAVSGGKLILLSTPFGRRGFFYHEWRSGNDWERYTVTADQCPRIPQAFLDDEKLTLGEHWFAQEYMCAFIDPTHRVFDEDLILEAFDSDVRPLFLGMNDLADTDGHIAAVHHDAA